MKYLFTDLARRCQALNAVGLRCGLDTLPDSDRCEFHQEAPAIYPPDHEEYSGVLDAQDFAQNVLQSWEFQQYIMKGLNSGKIPAQIILRLMDYAEGWGKPPERVEHTGKNGEPIITEVKRVIVYQKTDPAQIPTIVEEPAPDSRQSSHYTEAVADPLELHTDDGLDLPMIPVPPRRMH